MDFDEATEILHEEKAGGLAFDLILANATGNPPASFQTPPTKPTRTAEQINERLQSAEARRKKVESEKLEALSERLSRIEEISKRRQAAYDVFVTQTRKQIDEKMEMSDEKREAQLNSIRDKIKEHLAQVDMVHLKSKEQYAELASTINEKQWDAELARREHLNKMLLQLKKREEHYDKVRANHMEQVATLRSSVEQSQQERLIAAAENRTREMERRLSSLHVHNTERVRSVQDTQSRQRAELATHVMEKQDSAEERRRSELSRVVERAREDVRHVQTVRENKPNSAAVSNGHQQ